MLTFHDLYRRYISDVYRFAFWLSGNATDAEDIASETFIRAWTARGKIRTETVKAYLFTIARNLYLKQQRSDGRYAQLNDTHYDPQPGPETVTANRLDLVIVIERLQTLPEVDRTVFILRVQHELPYAEIARVMGLSVTAVKVKVHRVRLKLAATRMGEEVG